MALDGAVMQSQVVSDKEMNEVSLISAGKRGDALALDTLLRRHYRSLFHSAYRIMGNAEDAEDALQDGMLSAYRNLKSFEGRSQFRTWLTRIVINAALMRRRGLRLSSILIADNSESLDDIRDARYLASKSATPEQLFGRMEVREMICNQLHALSPTLRSVFLMRLVGEHETNETAKILNVPVNTVKARLWRARRQMLNRLGPRLHKEAKPLHENQAHFTKPAAGCE